MNWGLQWCEYAVKALAMKQDNSEMEAKEQEARKL